MRLYIDEVQEHMRNLSLELGEWEAAHRLTLGIGAIATTHHWPPLQEELEKKRQIALERMAHGETSDRDRTELAAEARVLRWLSDRPLSAKRELPGIQKRIAGIKEELETCSRRVPQTSAEGRT